jgi:hypothetical protein
MASRRRVRPFTSAACCGAALLALLLDAPAAHGQTAPPDSRPTVPSVAQAAGTSADVETMDVVDLIRKLRHKELTADEKAAALDPKTRMRAAAPVIGYKPTSGALIGVAGNVAFFLGDPPATRISSMVASLTYSSRNQVSLSDRFTIFGPADRWAVEGDNRAQWTSQSTYGIGAATTPDDEVNMEFNYFRVYETGYVRLYRRLLGGVGFHYTAHTAVRPGEDEEAGWSESPYVVYSEANGLPVESQTSAGVSVNVRLDSRDHAINPGRGWLGSVSYRPFFKGFLGGDSTWQEVYLDVRTYKALDAAGRHKLAFWGWGDGVASGVAPYMDLPATGMDNYGRSARGYGEGRFRGERLLYGEIEYRGTLTSNGLLGMVVFLNTTTLANSVSGERLFDHFATGVGAGLRLLLNKRSKTNLCFDIGFGKQGSHGVYLSVQEAF